MFCSFFFRLCVPVLSFNVGAPSGSTHLFRVAGAFRLHVGATGEWNSVAPSILCAFACVYSMYAVGCGCGVWSRHARTHVVVAVCLPAVLLFV